MNGNLYILLQIAVVLMGLVFFVIGTFNIVNTRDWRGLLISMILMLVAFIPAVVALWYFA